jgi:hypothetical protein
MAKMIPVVDRTLFAKLRMSNLSPVVKMYSVVSASRTAVQTSDTRLIFTSTSLLPTPTARESVRRNFGVDSITNPEAMYNRSARMSKESCLFPMLPTRGKNGSAKPSVIRVLAHRRGVRDIQ